MSTWHGVMADGAEFMRCGRSAQILWTDTKRIRNVHTAFTVDHTLKDEERFRNGLVRKPYERSLYERTFMSEPFIGNMLYQLSYVMLIERSINLSLIVYVDAIVNQAEYQ